MGMLDYLRCEQPLPDGFAKQDGWQTKSLLCELAVFCIAPDGSLVQTHPGWGNGAIGGPRAIPDYHGDLEFGGSNIQGSGMGFYSTENDEEPWSREYVARFTDGKLTRLSGGDDGLLKLWRDEGWKHVPCAEIEALWRAKSAEQGILQNRKAESEETPT